MLKNSSQCGITLIEVIVTLAVVAILASIAVPNVGSMLRTHQMNEAQETLMQILKSARTNAVSNGTMVTVDLTSSNKQVNVTYANGNSAPPVYTFNNDVALGGNVSFVFSPNGTASPASSVVMTSTADSTLTRTVTITVSGLITATR